jgi:hypothetical protein
VAGRTRRARAAASSPSALCAAASAASARARLPSAACIAARALPPRLRVQRSATAAAKRNLRRRGAASTRRGVRTAARQGPPPRHPEQAETPTCCARPPSRPKRLGQTDPPAPRARAAPLGAKEHAEAAATAREGTQQVASSRSRRASGAWRQQRVARTNRSEGVHDAAQAR